MCSWRPHRLGADIFALRVRSLMVLLFGGFKEQPKGNHHWLLKKETPPTKMMKETT